jgi:hypothetical protein
VQSKILKNKFIGLFVIFFFGLAASPIQAGVCQNIFNWSLRLLGRTKSDSYDYLRNVDVQVGILESYNSDRRPDDFLKISDRVLTSIKRGVASETEVLVSSKTRSVDAVVIASYQNLVHRVNSILTYGFQFKPTQVNIDSYNNQISDLGVLAARLKVFSIGEVQFDRLDFLNQKIERLGSGKFEVGGVNTGFSVYANRKIHLDEAEHVLREVSEIAIELRAWRDLNYINSGIREYGEYDAKLADIKASLRMYDEFQQKIYVMGTKLCSLTSFYNAPLSGSIAELKAFRIWQGALLRELAAL